MNVFLKILEFFLLFVIECAGGSGEEQSSDKSGSGWGPQTAGADF